MPIVCVAHASPFHIFSTCPSNILVFLFPKLPSFPHASPFSFLPSFLFPSCLPSFLPSLLFSCCLVVLLSCFLIFLFSYFPIFFLPPRSMCNAYPLQDTEGGYVPTGDVFITKVNAVGEIVWAVKAGLLPPTPTLPLHSNFRLPPPPPPVYQLPFIRFTLFILYPLFCGPPLPSLRAPPHRYFVPFPSFCTHTFHPFSPFCLLSSPPPPPPPLPPLLTSLPPFSSPPNRTSQPHCSPSRPHHHHHHHH
jgi:hypothetical protein